jgi:hypothetical protein
MTARVAMMGRRFGRLVVEAEAPSRVEPSGKRASMWTCRCDCGDVVAVRGKCLRRGVTQSCGCLHRELLAQRFTTHGATKGGQTSPEYRAWKEMLKRCYNPHVVYFKNYGGRGITVCQQWRDSFQVFLADMGSRPGKGYSVDRIDNDKGYEPGNCQWATRAKQSRNKRNNHWVTYKGQRMILTDAARDAGLDHRLLIYRIRAGWPESEWFRPVKKSRAVAESS